MRPPFRTGLVLLSLLGSTAAGGPVLAQAPPSAEALFNRGVEQMNAGKYEPGCKDIAESRRLDPQPGVLFTLATCLDRWGRIATAVALYGEYLALYDELPADRKPRQGERPKVARDRRAALGPDVPELTLTLPPDAPAGTVVQRDGQDVPAANLGVALPVDPGETVITARAPGGPLGEQRITIGKGEKKKLLLEVPASGAPPAGAAVPPASGGPSSQRKAAYVIGGVGLAALVPGVVTGILTVEKKGIIEQHCGAAIMAPKARCDPAGLDAASSAKTLGLVSTISIAAGLAGLGAGVVLLVTDRRSATPSATVPGRWIAPTVAVTPTGDAMIGAHGVW
jgi:hypothetical protein